VDFEIPADLADYLGELDAFIEREIRPLEQQDDNIRFFDHRRENARTDWDRGGLPDRQWEALLREAVSRADAAGHYRYAFPAEYGGREGTNLDMAVIREHLAAKGLGLHCDLQNEHMIVGNNVGLLLMIHYGSPGQRAEWAEGLAAGRKGFVFGITEPAHGSDATFMETTAARVREGGAGRESEVWVINGEKTWNTGVHAASHDLIFARTSGGPGDADGMSMCNYWANRLCCEAADRAMQVHGGLAYSRHKPFEHIYRHHRRYRITEGAEEIQMRRVAGYMFGYMRQRAPKGVTES
jgi:acyl-CoA dehydrogenase